MQFLDRHRNRPLVIAEIGVNHNGSLDTGRRLIDAAIQAGADAVKFQSFRAAELATAGAAKARYQAEREPRAESQLEMLKRLELAPEDFRALSAHCGERAIFLSTAFDSVYLDFLVGDLAMPAIKIASGEITNGPLLLHAARTGRPVLLSTGMSMLQEVEQALALLAFGYLQPAGPPTRGARPGSSAARKILKDKVALLHCVSEYPCPTDQANLRAMHTLEQAFGLEVGYSDHTAGIAVAVAAATLGACVIEKHLTLDRNQSGPDHLASLEPAEFAGMVVAIRTARAALGDGIKRPAPAELPNRSVARRSLVAARAIAAGEVLAPDNLAAKRPGTGVSPMEYWDRLGQRARRAYAAEEPIEP